MQIPFMGILLITAGILLFIYLFRYFRSEDVVSVTLLAISTLLVGLKFLYFHESLQLALALPVFYFLPFVLAILLTLRFGKNLFIASVPPSILVTIFVVFKYVNLTIDVLVLIVIGYLILFIPTAILVNFYIRNLKLLKLIFVDSILAIILGIVLLANIGQLFVIAEDIIAIALIPYVYLTNIEVKESILDRLKLGKFEREVLRKLTHGLVFFIFLPSWILELMVDVGVKYGISGFLGREIELISPYSKIQTGTLLAMTSIFLIALLLDFLRAKMNFPLVSDVLLRDREKQELAGYVYLIGATLFIATYFDLRILFASVGASVIGDAFAALVGMKFGKHKIKDRSVEGTLAEFITATLIACIFVPLYVAIIVGLVIAVIDLIIDGYVSDNIVFPIASAVVLELLL